MSLRTNATHATNAVNPTDPIESIAHDLLSIKLKIKKHRDLPKIETYLNGFPPLLDDTIVSLASSANTKKYQLETQHSRDIATERNTKYRKSTFEDKDREKVIELGKTQIKEYASGNFNKFFLAHAEEQMTGYDSSDIEERNLQWLGKREKADGVVTIPEILKLEGTKLVIVGASHVPAIMMEIKRG